MIRPRGRLLLQILYNESADNSDTAMRLQGVCVAYVNLNGYEFFTPDVGLGEYSFIGSEHGTGAGTSVLAVREASVELGRARVNIPMMAACVLNCSEISNQNWRQCRFDGGENGFYRFSDPRTGQRFQARAIAQ